MNGHGGARTGAGIPAGTKTSATLKRDEAKMLLMEALRPHADAVAKALADKARTGDVAAIKEFHDRYIGKAVQPIEGTGPEGSFAFKWLSDDNSNDSVQAA